MTPKREIFDDEPATRPDLPMLPTADDPPPPSKGSWRPRPPMSSATYSIVPSRGTYESGVAESEVAAVPASRPAPPPPPNDGTKRWRVELIIGRLGRVPAHELLEVPADAPWAEIDLRYHALVREFGAAAYRNGDAPLRRKVEILLRGLADAYVALSAAQGRRAYVAEIEPPSDRRVRPR